MNRVKRIALLLAGVSSLPALYAAPALAQEAAADERYRDEIVVTTRKREESLQTVPVAVTAFSAEQIESARITSVEDIALLTPGLTFAPIFGGSAATPVIRGQSTTIGEPNVGFFIDGVYQSSRSIMDSLLGDSIERVEVAKGPQSALYGRNTFAGAINFITKEPSNEFEGMLELTGGKSGHFDGRGSVSGPIIDDKLFFRIGGRFFRRDGYFTNELTGGDLDDRQTLVLSGALTATPTPAFKATLRVGFEDTNDGDDPLRFIPNNAAPANPTPAPLPPALQLFVGEVPNAQTGFAVTPGFNDRENLATSLSMDWDVGGDYTLTSITGFNDLNFESAFDNDYEARSIRFLSQRTAQEEFSQEIRITSPGNQRFRWMLGGYYYYLKIDTNTNDLFVDGALALSTALAGSPLGGLLPPGIINDTNETTENFAVFGQLQYDVTDRLGFTFDGRWSTEDKSAFAVDTNPLTGAEAIFDDEATFDAFTPRLTLDYKATDDIFLYMSAARAVKSGGFNVVTTAGAILPDERTYDQERSWNYEVGAKTTLLDGRAHFNIAGFYTDWNDQIVRALGATFAVLNANAGTTTAKGVEVELDANLAEGLDFRGGFAFTDSEYDRYTFGALAGLGVDPVLDGTRLQFVSKYTANGTLQYRRPLFDDYDWVARADVFYQSDQSIVQTADAIVGDATTVNLRTGVENDRYSLSVWVENLTEEDSAVTGAFITNQGSRFDTAASLLTPTPVGFTAFNGLVSSRNPRIWGVTARMKF
ncbi:MAG: TonB-dependent receptor [Parvularculaceae bacterium]